MKSTIQTGISKTLEQPSIEMRSWKRGISDGGKGLAKRAYLGLVLALIFTNGQGAVAQDDPSTGGGGSSHAVSMYNLGLTAYKQGSPESAIIFFRRACDIDPNLADAQYNLGVIYQSQKRYNEAVPRFLEVLRVKPADPDAHYQLGLCMIELGKTADARQTLAQIPQSDRHYADAQKRIQLLDAGQAGQASAAQTPAVEPMTQTSTQPQYDSAPQQPSVPQTAIAQQPLQEAVRPAPATPPIPILANSSVRVIATGFSAPAGLAFDRVGNLYIANFGNNTIDRISPDGVKATFSSGANLQGPIGVAVDGIGNVYVANYLGGTIARINPAGVSTLIATGFKKPYYLTMSKDGNLFVSQQADNSVIRMVLPQSVGAKP